MKICVVYPRPCSVSGKELAEFLECDRDAPYDSDRRDFTKYDVVFNYGGGYKLQAKKIINSRQAILTCIDKIATFQALKLAKVPHVAFVTDRRDVPASWECTVVRAKVDGKQGDSLDYVYRRADLPDAPLFTEYFDHRYEYRIVVFMGKVVGRYFKKVEGDDWELRVQPPKGFEKMDKACLKAAKAIGIDYVGFDVLANTKEDFRIIEANSGPMLMDEVAEHIWSYFYGEQ
jgi:glutathione synthase/RimK-type ligase-like ATP-grasp enzyme